MALFIVPNVPEDYPFKTKTRKEISVRGLLVLASLLSFDRTEN